jgi:hypothetical protein
MALSAIIADYYHIPTKGSDKYRKFAGASIQAVPSEPIYVQNVPYTIELLLKVSISIRPKKKKP